MNDQIVLQQILEKLQRIESQIGSITGKPPKLPVSENWISRRQVMDFLEYGDTQMCELLKSGKLVTAKVGKRIFVLRTSLIQLLEEGVVRQ